MRKSFFCFSVLSGLLLSGIPETSFSQGGAPPFIARGATWKYFDQGSLPAANWNANGFSDASWSSGRAELGYGDGDEATVVGFGPDAGNKFTTTYFRSAFNLADTAGMPMPKGSLLFDDGAVVYVNGIEIYRNNMPAGPIGYSTLALSAIAEGQWFNFDLPVRFLRPGANVVAVEVHQNAGSSSDISFDLQVFPGTPPVTFSTNLPLILLEVAGAIPDEPKASGRMKVIDNGPGAVNRATDPATDYDGFIGIERRGSTSQDLAEKKPYAIELRDAFGAELDTSLLGMPREHDWILLAPYSDKTLVREAFIYSLGDRIMEYAPRVRFCEVLLNGQYQGVYVLAEKIKRDPGRVDIAKLNPTENTGDDLTGGYIIKIDKVTGGNVVDGWVSSQSTPTFYQYHYPQTEDITPAQKEYIKGVFDRFEQVMTGSGFANPLTGYPSIIDVNTFVDYLIINELSRNVDGYRLSTYMYKDKDSNDPKLKMGPIWDYNITLGNADYCEGGSTTGFAYNFNLVCGPGIPFWWDRLLQDPAFKFRIGTRWQQLRTGVMSTAALMQRIDSLTALIQEPAVRNFDRYQILGVYIWPNSYVGGNYAAEISFLKSWLVSRLEFLDVAFGEFLDIPYDPYLYEDPRVYPNPSPGAVVFEYYVKESDMVEVRIIDQSGREIMNLTDDADVNGWNTSTWEWPDSVAPGLYYFTISVNARRVQSGRMLLHRSG